MTPKAFLFDLDGTLIDTESAWTAAMVDWIAAAGGEATLGELLPHVVGRNWLDIDRWLHAAYPVLGATAPEEDAVTLRAYYVRHAADPGSMVIRSSAEFFRKVSSIAPCVIVSGSPREDVETAARVCGIDDVTLFVLGAGDYARGKPDPSGFLAAAERLGVAPADCVVVEDSTVGVAAGVAAGMNVVALDRNPLAQSFPGARWIVKDLSEFDITKEFAP